MNSLRFLLFGICLLLAGCGLGVDATEIASTVDVSPPLDTVLVSDTVRFQLELRTEDGDLLLERPVRWESLGPAVAVVDTMGLVTGLMPGRTSVVATVDGQKGVAQVHVLSRQFPLFATGDLHACGATEAGEVHCWGFNSFGQLGYTGGRFICGEFPCERTVIRVAPGIRAVALGAGGEHTCAVADDGTTWCWGSNDEGQLGNGTFSSAPNPEPTRVIDNNRFATLDGGRDFTCGVTPSGEAYCWGSAFWGQLGNGSPTASNVPVRVDLTEPVVTVSTGENHACGLTEDGRAYCWGRNDSGQLGTGSQVERSLVPLPVAGTLKFKSISAGRSHTCAVALDGLAWCWGTGGFGQTGFDGLSNTPRRIDSAVRFARIDTGRHHTCAAAENGFVFCWGDNRYNQLGNGSSSAASVRTPVQISTNVRFTNVYAGELHTCATTAKSSVYCWGYGGAHQLGRAGRDACPGEPGLMCAARPVSVIGSLIE